MKARKKCKKSNVNQQGQEPEQKKSNLAKYGLRRIEKPKW